MIDLKVLSATFGAIFFAELADKTQLVGVGMSAKSGEPVAVLIGSVLAYTLVTVISVLLGALLGKFIRPELIRYTGATLFILVGALMFIGKI